MFVFYWNTLFAFEFKISGIFDTEGSKISGFGASRGGIALIGGGISEIRPVDLGLIEPYCLEAAFVWIEL